MDSKSVSLMKKLALGLGIILASQAVYHKAAAVITDTDVQTVSAVGNGVTTSYTIGFQFQANSELRVYLQSESTTPYTRTLLVYGAGAGKYTYAAGDPTTAVVLGTAPSATQRVIIKRVTSLTQQVDYVETDAFPAENHEEQMDRMEQSLQELDSAVSYKIGLSTVSTYTTPTYPDPVADKWAIYEHSGSNLTIGPSGSLTTGDVPQYIGTGWSTYNVTNGVVADLAAHVANVSNPHVVTATQVGKDTAQWNANKIKSVTVDDANIGQGKILSYNSGTGNLEYVAGSLLPIGGTDTVINVNSAGTDIEYDFIKNANIDAAASIVDTKLATISTASKVSNSATTATAANTMSAIMARDASGQVAASTFTGNLVGNVTGAVTGNASTATALAANPADCAANNLANVIGANGDLSCVQVSNSYVAAAAAIAVNKLAAVTANRAVVSDASGFITQSATTDTEIGYVSGVTSSIQTQINALSAGASTVQSYEVSNVGITASADSGAHTLTLGLTQANGSACSSGASACKIGFRSSTATSGQFVQRAIVAAPATLVIPSTATMGHVSAVEGLLHFYALDVGASGVEIGVTGHRILNEQVLQTTTAIGVTSDFNSGFYSTTARSNVPVRYLGTFKSTQTTAGTWDSAVTAAALTPAQKTPVFWLGDWLARLNVAATSGDPAATGEFRTLVKTNLAVSFSNAAATTAPSSANGMQIFSVSGTGAGGTSSDSPNRWEFFGEKNMRVVYYFYSAAAHTGRCGVSFFYDGSTEYGLDYGYSDRTGIGWLTIPLYTSGGTRGVGRTYASGTASGSAATSCYWDALVYEQ